ncbi:MAG: P-II family nitrogen regulator [Actinobacteria bacterium]|nr:P-II family nitrogen regulator [Actinomycetota bacterium]
MKEITAIIRTNKIQRTKEALVEAGYPSMTVKEVLGRGKQRGLQQEFCLDIPEPDDGELLPRVSFIPKRLLTLVVDDEDVDTLVVLITKVNQTGNVGDGKIIVSPVSNAVRVRTSEAGHVALS